MVSKSAKEWGPYAWYKFHKKALEYPENPCCCDIKRIKHYYHKKFLKYIDCKSCVVDYKKFLEKDPVRAKSGPELFTWTVDIHNIVNKKIGKDPVGYEEAYQYWTNKIFTNNINDFCTQCFDKNTCFQNLQTLKPYPNFLTCFNKNMGCHF